MSEQGFNLTCRDGCTIRHREPSDKARASSYLHADHCRRASPCWMSQREAFVHSKDLAKGVASFLWSTGHAGVGGVLASSLYRGGCNYRKDPGSSPCTCLPVYLRNHESNAASESSEPRLRSKPQIPNRKSADPKSKALELPRVAPDALLVEGPADPSSKGPNSRRKEPTTHKSLSPRVLEPRKAEARNPQA